MARDRAADRGSQDDVDPQVRGPSLIGRWAVCDVCGWALGPARGNAAFGGPVFVCGLCWMFEVFGSLSSASAVAVNRICAELSSLEVGNVQAAPGPGAGTGDAAL